MWQGFVRAECRSLTLFVVSQLDKPFLHMNETLHDLREKTVKAGNYIYPFSINLPEAMPSSMTFATNGLQSRIQYKLAAMFGKVRFERDFQVAARPLPPTRVPCFIEPKTEPIKSMGIRTIGSVTFGVMLEDAHIGRGTSLKLAIACRNDSTVDIRRVEIKLVELITLSTKNDAFTKKLTLLQSKDIELPSLIKSKVTRETMNTRRRSYNLHETNFAAIFEALLSDSNTIQIAVPKVRAFPRYVECSLSFFSHHELFDWNRVPAIPTRVESSRYNIT